MQEALLLPTDVLDFQLQHMEKRDSVDEFVQQSRHQSVLVFADGAATCEGIVSEVQQWYYSHWDMMRPRWKTV